MLSLHIYQDILYMSILSFILKNYNLLLNVYRSIYLRLHPTQWLITLIIQISLSLSFLFWYTFILNILFLTFPTVTNQTPFVILTWFPIRIKYGSLSNATSGKNFTIAPVAPPKANKIIPTYSNRELHLTIYTFWSWIWFLFYRSFLRF